LIFSRRYSADFWGDIAPRVVVQLNRGNLRLYLPTVTTNLFSLTNKVREPRDEVAELREATRSLTRALGEVISGR